MKLEPKSFSGQESKTAAKPACLQLHAQEHAAVNRLKLQRGTIASFSTGVLLS
jgi:hypothetical protein